MENLLVSFSGGETSGYMTYWILKHWSDRYNIEVVFANTGEEHEETLKFVRQCDEQLGFNTTWVEAKVHHNERRSSTHTVVDFEAASRDGEPFEEVIKKYGIPNSAFPHCTRELKTNPIQSYIENEVGWDDYQTAIGIRKDEIDRVDPQWRDKGFLYPLANHHPTTKQRVNAFWKDMPFRLNLKGYEGNCRACWKKSFRKLMTIASESPSDFDFMERMEEKYEGYTPNTRNKEDPPYRFYRNSTTVQEIKEAARTETFRLARDDSKESSYQTVMFDMDSPGGGCGEHCEPFNNS
jgi:hypothetical protein